MSVVSHDLPFQPHHVHLTEMSPPPVELMIEETEQGISLADRTTTTAGGINIAEFKRDVA